MGERALDSSGDVGSLLIALQLRLFANENWQASAYVGSRVVVARGFANVSALKCHGDDDLQDRRVGITIPVNVGIFGPFDRFRISKPPTETGMQQVSVVILMTIGIVGSSNLFDVVEHPTDAGIPQESVAILWRLTCWHLGCGRPSGLIFDCGQQTTSDNHSTPPQQTKNFSKSQFDQTSGQQSPSQCL